MKYIKPSVINGSVTAPASKSMMQRAIAACFLSGKRCKLSNSTLCNDSLSAISVIEKLGASVSIVDRELIIFPSSGIREKILNCGESGLAFRMFSPIASLYDSEIMLTGEGSLLRRPVDMIEKALIRAGVQCSSSSGFPPVTVKGPLKGGVLDIDAGVTSQLLTGLLMALPLCDTDSTVRVNDLKSRPYIDMTLQLLGEFGIVIINRDYSEFYIKSGQEYSPGEYNVEGDWSGASFLLVAGAVCGSVTVNNISYSSTLQADRLIVDVLKDCGADLRVGDDFVTVNKSELAGFSFDATDCPDLFPPLAALAVNCDGTSKITGTDRLVYKESNRAVTLVEEFKKMGADIALADNMLIIKGTKGRSPDGGNTDSRNDHRIAMACAVAGLNSSNGVYINNCRAVAKSYPDFFDDIKKLGAEVQ
ncbi:MAG: 3-phosphoshikimate 1-carboxyvinyltransferase [Oligoflexia bacterium]|nr:3-phosphoshikimate 1-carboxyvinyltransferase [Oligoflexia bacterium]